MTTQVRSAIAGSNQLIRWLSIGGFAFATALAAQVKFPVPGSLVPVTLQTAIVLLAALRLGAKDGALSQAVYIVGGMIGLPFFAGSSYGLAVLMGPTGGYLIGFVLAAYLLGRAKSLATNFARTWILTFAASLALFVPGVIQLKIVSGISWEQALLTGFVPFLIGDLLKVTATTSTYSLWRK